MTTAQPAVPAYLVVAQLHQDVTRCRIFEKHHILDDVLVLEHGMDSNLARKLQKQIKGRISASLTPEIKLMILNGMVRRTLSFVRFFCREDFAITFAA